jgi:hypothetical protein
MGWVGFAGSRKSAVENKTPAGVIANAGALFLDLQSIPWDCPMSVTLHSEKQFRVDPGTFLTGTEFWT